MSDPREPASVEVPACGCALPGAADPDTCYCGVEDLLQVIRRRYSLALLNAVHLRGTARFHDLETALPDASTSTLAATLRALTAVQLLRREDHSDSAVRSLYRLTPSGLKLLSRLRRLLEEVREQE